MTLALSKTELHKALDTDTHRAARKQQYGSVEKSGLAERVLHHNHELASDELATLLMDGRALWNFIETIIQSKPVSINKAAAHNILHNLALLPEGPFFYAVRSMYEESINRNKYPSDMLNYTDTFDEYVRQFVYYTNTKETSALQVGAERLRDLGHLYLINNSAETKDSMELIGCALVSPVNKVLLCGKVAGETLASEPGLS